MLAHVQLFVFLNAGKKPEGAEAGGRPQPLYHRTDIFTAP